MNKREALEVFVTALVRELLREDEPLPDAPPSPPSSPSGPFGAAGPQPRFDFTPDSDAQYGEQSETCEHGGILFERELCPLHGPSAEVPPTAEELDDMASEEVSQPVARAQRIHEQQIAEQKARVARGERLWPEDLEMRGMGPPPDVL
ncbi:MAG: hypothetical protein ACLQVI_43240 [Polyangiaceae bacterium]